MIVVNKKHFFVGLGITASVVAVLIFWFAYFQNTSLYVNLFRSEAECVGDQCEEEISVDIKANGSDGPIDVTCGSTVNVSWTSEMQGSTRDYICEATSPSGLWTGSREHNGQLSVIPT